MRSISMKALLTGCVVAVVLATILHPFVPHRASHPTVVNNARVVAAERATRDSIDRADRIATAREIFSDSGARATWRRLDKGSLTHRAAAVEDAVSLVLAMDDQISAIDDGRTGPLKVTWKDIRISEDHASKLEDRTARRCARVLVATFSLRPSRRPDGLSTASSIVTELDRLVPDSTSYASAIGVTRAHVRSLVVADMRRSIQTVRRQLRTKTTKLATDDKLVPQLQDLQQELEWAVSTFKITPTELGMTAMEFNLALNLKISEERTYESGGDFSMI